MKKTLLLSLIIFNAFCVFSLLENQDIKSTAPTITYVYHSNYQCNTGSVEIKVSANGNGYDITSYELFVEGVSKEVKNTSSESVVFTYIADVSELGKPYSIKVTNTESSSVQSGVLPDLNRYWTPSNNSTFPKATPINKVDFPITNGVTFTEPVVTYHGPFYFFTENQNLIDSYNNAISSDPNATISVNIPYLGADFNCKVFPPDKFETYYKSSSVTNSTFFLDEGEFLVDDGDGRIVLWPNMQVVGASTTGESVIKTTHVNQWDFSHYGANCLFENLVFDGTNKNLWGKYFFYFKKNPNGTSHDDNFMMRKVKLRNIGNHDSGGWFPSKKDMAVMNFIDREGRDETMHRYFIDVTIESAKLYHGFFGYDGCVININTTDGLYFRNLSIDTEAGHDMAIQISNSLNYPKDTWPGYNYGSRNIVFSGTLNLPTNKAISVKSFDSRGISFPDEYHFWGLNPHWDKMNPDSYAIVVVKKDQFLNQENTPEAAYITTLATVDASDGTYVVRDSKSRNTQLNTIASMLNHTDANNMANLPNPTIKMINPVTGKIGGFDVPDYGKTTHIVCLNNIDDPLGQTSEIPYDNNTISLSTTNANNIYLYNIDFSDYYEISDAVVSGLNQVKNSTVSTFYHDRFRDCTSPLPIELLSFNAFLEGDKVKLEWESLAEVNNDYYQVYKSKDATSWILLDKVTGAGNSSEKRSYGLLDKRPYTPITYYKLTQTDYDGQIRELGIRQITNNAEKTARVYAYPNPTKEQVKLKGACLNANSLQVINALGMNVTNSVDVNVLPDGALNINLSKLSEGIYFIYADKSVVKVIKN